MNSERQILSKISSEVSEKEAQLALRKEELSAQQASADPSAQTKLLAVLVSILCKGGGVARDDDHGVTTTSRSSLSERLPLALRKREGAGCTTTSRSSLSETA